MAGIEIVLKDKDGNVKRSETSKQLPSAPVAPVVKKPKKINKKI